LTVTRVDSSHSVKNVTRVESSHHFFQRDSSRVRVTKNRDSSHAITALSYAYSQTYWSPTTKLQKTYYHRDCVWPIILDAEIYTTCHQSVFTVVREGRVLSW